MSSLGDTIEELSTISPLNAGLEWTSQAMVPGQYNSLSVQILSDQPGRLIVQWSGDNGKHWDVSDSVILAANVALRSAIVVQQKDVRFIFQNTSPSNQTFLRLFTYGVTANTNSITSLVPSTGPLASVIVDNLPTTTYGDLSVEINQPKKAYVFTTGSSGNMNTTSWKSPYTDLKSAANASAPKVGFDQTPSTFPNGCLRFHGFQANHYGMLKGQCVNVTAGSGIACRFTAGFNQPARPAPTDKITRLYTGMGNGSVGTYNVVNGCFFGYYDTSYEATDTSAFGIIICDGMNAPLFISRQYWNNDSATGLGRLPFINPGTLNSYMIQAQLGGDVEFYITNPNTGQYSLVHTHRWLNTQIATPSSVKSSFVDPNFALLFYAHNDATVSVPLDASVGIFMASFSLYIQGEQMFPIYDRYCITGNIPYPISGSSGNTVLTMVNLTSIGVPAMPNNRTITIDTLRLANATSGICEVRLFRNANYSGGTFSYVDQDRSSVYFANDATYTSGGQFIYSYYILPSSTEQLNLTDNPIELGANDNLVFFFLNQANDGAIAMSLSFY